MRAGEACPSSTSIVASIITGHTVFALHLVHAPSPHLCRLALQALRDNSIKLRAQWQRPRSMLKVYIYFAVSELVVVGADKPYPHPHELPCAKNNSC